jgi:hypothetical protein
MFARGRHDVTVLYISQSALDIAEERLGRNVQRVAWIHADIRSWSDASLATGRRIDVGG